MDPLEIIEKSQKLSSGWLDKGFKKNHKYKDICQSCGEREREFASRLCSYCSKQRITQ